MTKEQDFFEKIYDQVTKEYPDDSPEELMKRHMQLAQSMVFNSILDFLSERATKPVDPCKLGEISSQAASAFNSGMLDGIITYYSGDQK